MAIALGISIVILAAVFVGGNSIASDTSDQLKDLALTVLLPALVLGAMRLFDDMRSLSPWPRLIAQTVSGTAVTFVIVENGTISTLSGEADSGNGS